MTKSEIMKEAHRLAGERRDGYSTYREALGEQIRAIHNSLRAASRPCTGFQVIEPWYKRQRYNPRSGQWVTV